MFCNECGQPIIQDEGTGKLVHTTAKTYPVLNDHEPVACDSDKSALEITTAYNERRHPNA